MKRVSLVIILIAASFCASAQALSFMTYNIRYDNPKDGEDNWHKRKEWLASQIKFYEPHVLGIQEGLHDQVTYLDEQLADYNYVGVGRDNGKEKGEYSAIYYKSSALEVLVSNTFWLSETLDKPSKGWDANIKRICTYALFQHKETKKKFWVFNTHFDHKGNQAREESAKLILEQIETINKENLSVILMGDFNANITDQPIIILKEKLQDTYDVSAVPPFGPEGTANAFKFDRPVTSRIDYIFVNGLKVNKCAILSDSKNLHYPSDHLPVFAEIIL